jgi:glycosyltransferase involved in cell wall biosynthesis
MSVLRARLFDAARVVAGGMALPVLALEAAWARRVTRQRRRVGARPRLVYGPTPIISIRYMSEALRRRGYETTTFVYGVARINERSDFDASFADLLGGSQGWLAVRLRELFGPHLAFARLLRRGDVFHFFFDGGFLRATPLAALEARLLHLAGKKLVLFPYGGDVAVPSRTRSAEWRAALEVDYPELYDLEDATRRRIERLSRAADFVVACLVHYETLPRWDLLTTHYYPLDTDAWAPAPRSVASDGPLTVFHSANHRAMKGTDELVRAVAELETEGLDIELVVAEGMPNAEVRRQLADADVFAEQFLLGYALAAMEGMALAKPVLSNLTDDAYYELFRRETGLDECPIVSTEPRELKDVLRRLAESPELRAELGAAGRRYVVDFHGYDAVARMWELVYDTVWHGRPLPTRYWHPKRDPRAPAGEAGAPTEALEPAA